MRKEFFYGSFFAMEKKNIITVTIGLLCVFLLASCGKADKAEEKETDGKEVEKTEPKEVKKLEGREARPLKSISDEKDKADYATPPEDVAAPPDDAKKTESGLASKVMKSGTGEAHPKATDQVSVHYTGWTTDGKMFDSSKKRGKPSQFPLNRVIPGWTEGVQLMVVGEERRLWIPEDLAYKGRRGMPQGMLVFDIELLEIL